MTADRDAQWIVCTDRKLINGLMRELFIWDATVSIVHGGLTNYAQIYDLDEPEDASRASSRIIKFRVEAAIAPGFVGLSAQIGGEEIRWSADLEADGQLATTPFPPAIEIREVKDMERGTVGDAVVSVFCRSGAITAPFIRAQKTAVRAYARTWPMVWPPSLIAHRLERDAAGRVIGHLCAVRMGDNLVMITDVARTRPINGRAAGPFLREALSAVVEFAYGVDQSARIMIGWAPKHPLWSNFDRFLSANSSVFQTVSFSTLYTRFTGHPDTSVCSVTLFPLSTSDARVLVERLVHASSRQLAKSLGIGDPFAGSRLGQELALAGAPFDRTVVLVRREGQSIALALFTGLPSTWNLRQTCSCVWLFPFDAWAAGERGDVYEALGASSWATSAPGVLEIAPVDGNPGLGKWLDWRIVDPAALAAFDGWAE